MSIQCKIDKKENTITFGLSIVDILSDEGKKELEWMTSHWKELTDMVHEKINECTGKEVDDVNEEDTEEEDDNKAAECTCPECGCHEFEVIQRLGEVTLCPETVTIDKRGNVEIIVKDDPDAFYDAEVMDEYWRCSNCGREIVDEDFAAIL